LDSSTLRSSPLPAGMLFFGVILFGDAAATLGLKLFWEVLFWEVVPKRRLKSEDTPALILGILVALALSCFAVHCRGAGSDGDSGVLDLEIGSSRACCVLDLEIGSSCACCMLGPVIGSNCGLCCCNLLSAEMLGVWVGCGGVGPRVRCTCTTWPEALRTPRHTLLPAGPMTCCHLHKSTSHVARMNESWHTYVESHSYVRHDSLICVSGTYVRHALRDCPSTCVSGTYVSLSIRVSGTYVSRHGTHFERPMCHLET